MKKIGIYTLNGNNNYGNRLQNYALKNYLENSFKCDVNTIWYPSRKELIKEFFKRKDILSIENIRFNNFYKFSHNFLKIKYYFSEDLANKYDRFIVGSDQVWNYNFCGFNSAMFLEFGNVNKNISYAASFGVDKIPEELNETYKNGLNNIKYISVREDRGKEIVKELTGRTDVEVLVDPTMLLTAEEWDKVSKKPKQLKTDKYILNYFLGELSESRKKEIDRIAKENGCEVINILDKNSPFYQTGPSEFLYLEKNAFLICTDSFHSCVFAILYNRPFIVFDREQKDLVSMNSRIDTLLSKFKLEDRRYKGKIEKEGLLHNYNEAYKILENEREKSNKFLKKALDIQN